MSEATDDWGDTAVDDMSEFSMDTENVDESNVGSRVTVDKVGKYHLEVADIKQRFDTLTDGGKERSPDLLFTCVVCESVTGQCAAGAIYFHSVMVGGKGGSPIEQWQLDSAVNFLYGIGVLRKVTDDKGESKFIDPATGTTKIDVMTLAERCKGLQFVADIKRNKSKDPQYDDRIELMFGRGGFRVDDPAVSDVPMNADALSIRRPYPAGELDGDGKAPSRNADVKPPDQPPVAADTPDATATTPAETPAPESGQPVPVGAAADSSGDWDDGDL